ncbi:MAG TPA: type IV pilus modification protein PilV [Rudaea sp.]|nr:type IV pilus modification protein PilV [Rudaea sp.]
MARNASRGFTLLEVLVALLIFSLGLIGLAELLTVSVKTNHSAYLRTQAMYLAQDMVDRMRANTPGIWAGLYTLNAITTPPTTPASATSATPQDCTASSCSTAQIASRDLQIWQNELVQFLPNPGVALTCNPGAAGALPTAPYSNTCEIEISWTQLAVKGESSAQASQPEIFDWVFQP